MTKVIDIQVPLDKGNFKVVRNCCTSGNCIECIGKSPFGMPMRVEQMTGISKAAAEYVAKNWQSYKAVVETM